MATQTSLSIPEFFDPSRVKTVWRVPYQQRASQAKSWAQEHAISPAAADEFRICLLLIDVQNTFCIPDFELFVGGRSGLGAVEDNVRLCEFIYRNLGHITQIMPTLDTHTVMQVFHGEFWVDAAGNHPPPMTLIHAEDVHEGRWQVNPAVTHYVGTGSYEALQRYAAHYVDELARREKFPLTIWPYHSMLGGIGHALVAAVEEACFFHTIARSSQTRFELKGSNPLTENYSVLSPEVLRDGDGQPVARKNSLLIQTLLDFDAVVVAGQAKSHCVAWSVEDLLREIQAKDPALAGKVYLLEDCTSAVVVPEVVDFTDAGNAAFERFAQAGMHRITSEFPLAKLRISA